MRGRGHRSEGLVLEQLREVRGCPRWPALLQEARGFTRGLKIVLEMGESKGLTEGRWAMARPKE